jgi:hypothetical protein
MREFWSGISIDEIIKLMFDFEPLWIPQFCACTTPRYEQSSPNAPKGHLDTALETGRVQLISSLVEPEEHRFVRKIRKCHFHTITTCFVTYFICDLRFEAVSRWIRKVWHAGTRS